MLLLISFHATHMHGMEVAWKESSTLHSTPRILDDDTYGIEPYMGGTLVLYNWEKDHVSWQIHVDGAAGFCLIDRLLYINQTRLNEIVVLKANGQEQARISHPLINNPHSLCQTSQGLLLTSTGLDCILELTLQGKLLYAWNGLEHGYGETRQGKKRTVDLTQDHRYRFYATNEHTTHINSARFIHPTDESLLLATLFHQGTIVSIDRRTGKATTMVADLHHPHDIRPLNRTGGWMVSDTGMHRVVIYNHDWSLTRTISGNYNWVQCAVPVADGSIVLADTNHHQIVRVYDEPGHREARKFPPDWRIFHIEEITQQQWNVFLS